MAMYTEVQCSNTKLALLKRNEQQLMQVHQNQCQVRQTHKNSTERYKPIKTRLRCNKTQLSPISKVDDVVGKKSTDKQWKI